jgi:PPOX class probable F420-dependent enzyme
VTLPDDIRHLFDASNTAHVATLLPDGSPHSVPIWTSVEGDRIAFLTSPDSRKARNFERDPRIALSVTDSANAASMAMVRGRVVERMDGDAAWELIDKISNRYIGMPYPLRADRSIYLVEAEHAWARDFSQGL